MRSLGVLILLVGSLWPAAPGLAEELETERPDRTASVATVPHGAAQVEMGEVWQRGSGDGGTSDRRVAVEAHLRVGLTDRVELGLEGEPYLRLRGEGDAQGSGDLTVNVKVRVRTAPPEMGVLAFAKVPTASAPLGTGRPDAGLVGIASVILPGPFELSANVGVVVVGQRHAPIYLVQVLGAVQLQADVVERRLQAYGEVLSSTPEERGGQGQVAFGAGLVLRVGARVALDAGAETTLVGSGPVWVVRAGLSTRWGR